MPVRYPISRPKNTRIPSGWLQALGMGVGAMIPEDELLSNPYHGKEGADVPYTDKKYDARIYGKDMPFVNKGKLGKEANAEFFAKGLLAKQGAKDALELESERSRLDREEVKERLTLEEQSAIRLAEEQAKRQLAEEQRQMRLLGKHAIDSMGELGNVPYWMSNPEEQSLYAGERMKTMYGNRPLGYASAEADTNRDIAKAGYDEKKALVDTKLAEKTAFTKMRSEEEALNQQLQNLQSGDHKLAVDKVNAPVDLLKNKTALGQAETNLRQDEEAFPTLLGKMKNEEVSSRFTNLGDLFAVQGDIPAGMSYGMLHKGQPSGWSKVGDEFLPTPATPNRLSISPADAMLEVQKEILRAKARAAAKTLGQ